MAVSRPSTRRAADPDAAYVFLAGSCRESASRRRLLAAAIAVCAPATSSSISGVTPLGQTRAYTRTMLPPASRRFTAGLLSMLIPGAGQLYQGARRRGSSCSGLTALVLAACCVVVGGRARQSIDRRLVAAVLAVDLGAARASGSSPSSTRAGRLGGRLAALVALTAAPHVAAAWVTVRSYDVLETRLRGRGALRHGVRPRLVLLAHVVDPLPDGCRRTRGSGRSSSGSGRARWRRWRRRPRPREREAGDGEAVDDDPPARHRRGPRQLGRAHRHDHPRRDPARHRPRRRLRRPAQPRPGAARRRRGGRPRSR